METYNKLTSAFQFKQMHTNMNKEPTRPYLSFSIDYILGKSFGKRREEMRQVADDCEEQCIQRFGLSHSACCTCDDLDREGSVLRFEKEKADFAVSYPAFDWMQCTRYKPPKVTRAKRKKTSLSRSSRQPRIPFTPYQQATLEHAFQKNPYVDDSLSNEISSRLHLSKKRIKIWYQNRRARDRREEQTKNGVNPSMIYVE